MSRGVAQHIAGNPVTVHDFEDVFWKAMSADVWPAPELPGTAVHFP